MLAAVFYSMFSKDESTQVGAVIIDPDSKTELSAGWNGLPRGVDDNVSERHERPEKYMWFVHAEENAIANAARNGIRLAGSTLYVTHLPCPSCARKVIQAGIKEVVVFSENYAPDSELSLRHGCDRSMAMFGEAGVSVRPHEPRYELNIIETIEI
jgi:dCMP deaminase